ncbi:MAG: manganese efflux pump MntP family protein [Oscillospiraceae bacterium]|nr:manganese efflux pump MntP family protein [Oscillospiraceae bacterium]
MQLWELFIIAVSLSMDAFAVSVCKGLSVKKVRPSHALIAGLYFGGFQLLMPLLGYFLGGAFESFITSIDHWIAFVLLVLIGAGMVKESREACETLDDSFAFRAMLPLAVATSIDALAVGVTFAFLQVNILPAVCLIGVITFLLSAAGIKIGNRFGARYKSKAELVGGIVLIVMGIKILAEHLLTHTGVI